MKTEYVFDIDDRLPLKYAFLYGMQWAFIMFPALIIAATLCAESLPNGQIDKVRFLQFTLLTSGFFTVIQTLWGHRYPLLEGPATALMLAFVLLAPLGLRPIQAGMMIGGGLLILTVLSGQLDRVTGLFTPNVTGVILMLIALGLLRPLMGFMIGAGMTPSHGEGRVFLISVGLVLFMATLSHRLQGFLKTISILIGMFLGSLLFHFLGPLEWQKVSAASWVSLSPQWVPSIPRFHWAAAVAFACAYLAVMANTLGSLQGISAITDPHRLPHAASKGMFVTGAAGIVCGLFGVVGTVSYSMSPGVILANRVASRFAVTSCGIVLVLAAFLPKLAAFISLVPGPVVGSALCVGLGGQVGVGISAVACRQLTSRDYFVVGLPVILGTLTGFLPNAVFSLLPPSLQVFVANSLIVGIFLVLLLEHLLFREKK
ncbi:MAG: purine/pyrimidine permease [Deltaproteobacteria bacterium]|nr:purine/pyrimidine permease [Deltaproteobacteria bacterium]